MDTTTPPTTAALRHPLRDGNRLQRAYYRWAAPHYARMAPDLREQAEGIDQFIYTAQGVWAWTGWLCGMGGLMAGLRSTGLPLTGSLVLGLVIWVALSCVALAAWLRPQALLSGSKAGKALVLLVAGVAVGGLSGFVVGHVIKHGELDFERLLSSLTGAVGTLLPALGAAVLGLGLLILAVASASRKVQATRLATAQLKAERDNAARHAAEAELRLLQAQIHPHFVFNTLATLQHWVDKRDERAGPLLRELTGFLRRSTEMLGRASVPLADEAQAVQHYLAILQARLGERLRYQVDIDPATAAQALPPGLLLTLVENAIEHGLEPKIGGGQLAVRSQCNSAGLWSLQVEDDGLGLSPTAQDDVGLRNLRQRLRHHFGLGAQFELTAQATGGTLATIHFNRLNA